MHPLLFKGNFSDTKNSTASSNKHFPPKWRQDSKGYKPHDTMQYHNKAGFILLVWSKEGEKKKSKVGKHFPYGRVPQRLRIQVRGPPVRPCTPHNLHSQAKTIKTAPTAAPFPAIEHSDRSRVCKQKVGKRKSNWQNHNFFSKSEWFF